MRGFFVATLVLVLMLAPVLVSRGQIARTDGTAMTSGGTPTVSACGSAPAGNVTGTDTAGTIAVGGGVVTSCQLNFSTTLSAAPPCVVSPWSTVIIGGPSSVTASALIVGLSASLGGGTITYFCPGR